MFVCLVAMNFTRLMEILSFICILFLLIKLYVEYVYIATSLVALCLVINSLVLIDSIPLFWIYDCFKKLTTCRWWNQWLYIFRWNNLVVLIWLIHCAMTRRKLIFKILILIVELWSTFKKQAIILCRRLLLREISWIINFKLVLKYFPIYLFDFLSKLVTERLQLKLSILQLLWKILINLFFPRIRPVTFKIWIGVNHSISDIFCNIYNNTPSILAMRVRKIFQIDFFEFINRQINW
jgi:hypothetical protein